MGDLISLLFLARELAHRSHLKTKSYAEHKALELFYNEIVEVADTIAEAYQGNFNTRLEIPLGDGDINQPIREVLRNHLVRINAYRYNACSKDETSIQNLIDEALNVYQKALYLLDFQ